MVQELLNKYIWLVQTFMKAGSRGLSLEEIQDRWFDRFDCEYPRRSFNNHRIAIADVFGIDIECDRSTNRYYIAYTDDVSNEAENAKWLINTFTVNNLLSESRHRLSGRVSVENIPSGQTWLTPIMEAMETETTLHIAYQKYDSPESEYLHVDPYAVKEFSRRWYLIGYCHQRDGLRVYGLDRIRNLEETTMDFDMPADFDIDELFRGSFGIYIPREAPEHIIFKAKGKEAKYLRDLPLHSSQQEIENDGHSSIFSMDVCVSDDLVMELCKRGSRIEVLEPLSLRVAVAYELREALEQY